MALRSFPSAIFLAIVLIAVGLTMTDLWVPGSVPIFRDLLYFNIPSKHFLTEALRSGDIPLWNPYTSLGTPFLAGLQSAVLYPPSWILVVGFPLGVGLFLGFHYLVAAAGMWAFLRREGVQAAAAAIGAITFAAGGYLVSMLNVTSHLQTAVWTPWLFFFWGDFMSSRRRRALAGTAGGLAIQFLGGGPEIFILSSTLLVGWTAARNASDARRLASDGAILGGLAILAMGICAFQILSTLEYLGESVRKGSLDFGEVTAWSLEPVGLLQLLLPYSSRLMVAVTENTTGWFFQSNVPWILNLYVGILPLILIPAGLVAGRDRTWWALVLVGSIVLALGANTPVFGLLYEAFPIPFGRFRYPEKFWFLTHFGIATVAAYGAHAVFEGHSGAWKAARAALLTLIAVGGSVVALYWIDGALVLGLLQILKGKMLGDAGLGAFTADFLYKNDRTLFLLAGIFTLLVLLRRGFMRPWLATAGLVVLTAVDVGSINKGLNMSMDLDDLLDVPPLVDVNELQQEHGRIFHYQKVDPKVPRPSRLDGLTLWKYVFLNVDDVHSLSRKMWPTFYQNVGMLYGVPATSGMDGIMRSTDVTLLDVLWILPEELAVRVLGLYGTRYLIGPEPLEFADVELRRTWSDEDFHVYRVPGALPYAYFAGRLTAAPHVRATYNRIIAKDFVAGFDAVVDEIPPGWSDAEPGMTPGTVGRFDHQGDRIVVEVTANRPAFLVVNESWYPGWAATIDGAPAELYRANGIVRGVVVPAGQREVVLEYRPRSFRLGVAISAASLGVWALLAIWASRGRHATARKPRGDRREE